MEISIGADHGGFTMKEFLKKHLQKIGYTVKDRGTFSEESVDYPDIALKVALDISQNTVPVGLIIDGAGVGSTMVANKVPGVRAALCNDLYSASNAREHNNANVLVMGSQVIGNGLAVKIIDTFLKTPFAGGRHEKRVQKINALDSRFRSTESATNPNRLEDIVSRIVQTYLLKTSPQAHREEVSPGPSQSDREKEQKFQSAVLTENDVVTLLRSGTSRILISERTIVTPLAMDLLREKRIHVSRASDREN